MADGGSSLIGAAEYEAIEAAVMETARGRWFLAEYARRNRTADTALLLEAIGRLEQAVVGDGRPRGADRFRLDLAEMAGAISRMKGEVASLRPADGEHGPLLAASEALDGIVRTTERATSEILEAAERTQEAAWTLREEGADPSLCDDLDRQATAIYTACSFQDLTAQRTVKVVGTLRFLEHRIGAMIAGWGGAEPHGGSEPHGGGESHGGGPHDGAESSEGVKPHEGAAPSGGPLPPSLRLVDAGDGLCQGEIDAVIVDAEAAAAPDLGAAAENCAEVEGVAEAAEIVVIQAPASDSDRPDVEESLPATAGPALAAAPVGSGRGSRTDALATIDALPTREKLRRFT